MPIAVRLLLALGLLALFVTALVGFSARSVARREVERGFGERIDSAILGARAELAREARTLEELAVPLCRRSEAVARALADLDRGRPGGSLGPERRAAIGQHVSEQQRAFGLDELVWLTGDGVVLAGRDAESPTGPEPATDARALPAADVVRLGTGRGQPVLELHCVRHRGTASLHVIAARRIEPILRRVGTEHGVSLALAPSADGASPAEDEALLRRQLTVPEIPGLEVVAEISRRPLFDALAQIDRSVLLAGGIAVLLSIALAVFIAGGLSRPIVQLAAEAREVVHGKPVPVRAKGGRELAELARAFNRTIDELAAMRRRVAAVERIAARREMARQIAHEIKNPLAPIRAAVETLRRLRERGAPQFDEYFEEATATVLAEVHRISEIVTEFTRYERLPAPKFDRVDLASVARGVIALCDGRGITGAPRVKLDAEPVPAILADRDQLVQVLTNLVQNGVEAARGLVDPPVMPRIEVRIGRDSKHTVRISVEDNGPGVAAAMRERLFEPYASTKADGTGLGLAIAQRIVYEHGGEIRYEDAPGGGARFVATLPIDGPSPSERAPDSRSGSPAPSVASR